MRRIIIVGLTWSICVVAAACTAPANPMRDAGTMAGQEAAVLTSRRANLTVFAAASLTEAFQDIGQAFEALHPGSAVSFNFAGSQRLALLIEQGARTDVFASADQHSVDRLVAAGLIQPDAPLVFAHNRMVVVAPVRNPGRVRTLADLAKPGLKLILAGEEVPAGAYARQILANLSADPAYGAGFEAAALGNVVSNEENVKQVLAKVHLGEVDAGIVYGSDVTPGMADGLLQIDVPDRFNARAEYVMVDLDAASDPELARRFIQFVLSPDGQRVLEEWGLGRATE